MPQIQEAPAKYLQIASHIRDQIIRGDLLPGAEIPSERQIAQDWKVSRPTATRALQVLRYQGLVESRQGAGTYVRDIQMHRRAVQRTTGTASAERNTGQMKASRSLQPK